MNADSNSEHNGLYGYTLQQSVAPSNSFNDTSVQVLTNVSFVDLNVSNACFDELTNVVLVANENYMTDSTNGQCFNYAVVVQDNVDNLNGEINQNIVSNSSLINDQVGQVNYESTLVNFHEFLELDLLGASILVNNGESTSIQPQIETMSYNLNDYQHSVSTMSSSSFSHDSVLNTSFNESSSSTSPMSSLSSSLSPSMPNDQLDQSDIMSLQPTMPEMQTFQPPTNKSSKVVFLDKKEKFKKKPVNMKDCLHVWEFLKDLLKEEESSQNNLIKWLDKSNGIFKILNPKEIANRWGEKKADKQNMSYPNMARGIRYSREAGGYFDNVSKDFKFGKKLVYKFSKKTTNHCEWLRSFMN